MKITIQVTVILTVLALTAAEPQLAVRQNVVPVTNQVPVIFNGTNADQEIVDRTPRIQICFGVGGGNPCSSCTASIVKRKWLLTAGHCLENNGIPPTSLKVIYKPENGLSFDAATVYIHKTYLDSLPDLFHDIGLIKLTKGLKPFNGKSSRYTLGRRANDVPPAGTMVRLAGYGQTSAGSGISTVLQEGTTTITTDGCSFWEGRGFFCTDTQRDSGVLCPGDSGGPLFIEKGGTKYRVSGVNSAVLVTSGTSFNCGDGNGRHIYARVSNYRTALQDCMKKTPSGACDEMFYKYDI